MRDLEGKVAFITGGSSGIGLGIARACHEAGMKVAISYLTAAHLEQAQSYFREHFLAVRLDVRDRSAFSKAADQIEQTLGPVQLLVNNAGIGVKSTVGRASWEDWDLAIDVNLRGVVHGVGVFVPRMLASGLPAQVVSTASMSGLMVSGSAGVYATTKFAVVGMMESLRAELAGHGIGVSVFCPGVVQSRIASWQRNYSGGQPLEVGEPLGMDPLECGRRVLAGVQDNAMFIFSHPEFREALSQKCRALLASFPKDHAPMERLQQEKMLLQSTVYDHELSRLEGAGS